MALSTVPPFRTNINTGVRVLETLIDPRIARTRDRQIAQRYLRKHSRKAAGALVAN